MLVLFNLNAGKYVTTQPTGDGIVQKMVLPFLNTAVTCQLNSYLFSGI
jgi:hypothetical protein